MNPEDSSRSPRDPLVIPSRCYRARGSSTRPPACFKNATSISSRNGIFPKLINDKTKWTLLPHECVCVYVVKRKMLSNIVKSAISARIGSLGDRVIAHSDAYARSITRGFFANALLNGGIMLPARFLQRPKPTISPTRSTSLDVILLFSALGHLRGLIIFLRASTRFMVIFVDPLRYLSEVTLIPCKALQEGGGTPGLSGKAGESERQRGREEERKRRSVENADFAPRRISSYLTGRYVAEFRVNPIQHLVSFRACSALVTLSSFLSIFRFLFLPDFHSCPDETLSKCSPP